MSPQMKCLYCGSSDHSIDQCQMTRPKDWMPPKQNFVAMAALSQPTPQGVAEVMELVDELSSTRFVEGIDGDDAATERARALVEQALATIVQERDALKDEVKSDGVTIDRMLKILAETAIALKGPEKELHRHGCHDISKLASVAMIEIEVLKARVAELEQDAGRFQQAMALSDNCESLYAAVLNNGTDVKQIRAEFDAAMAASKEAK